MSSEREERRHLLAWLDKSLMHADVDSLRFIACVAAVRVMNHDELERLTAVLKKDEVIQKDRL